MKKKGSLENSLEEPAKVDELAELKNDMEAMKIAHNGFVKAQGTTNEKLDSLIQMMIRPVQQEPVKEGEKPKDPRSEGVGIMLNKKLGDASVGELVQAGDLALRVHDRRQGLTDLEEFMVQTGKDTIVSFGSAQSHKLGSQKV